MESYQETRRQIRISLALIGVILPTGVIGFMLLEQLNLLDSIYLTVVTLTTIGYGDVVARSPEGRAFTILMIIAGVGIFGFAIQATLNFWFSAENANIRQRRRTYRKVASLQHHYIITGEGELVNQTIAYLMRRAATRQTYLETAITQRFDRVMNKIFGTHNLRMRPIRRLMRRAYLLPFSNRTTLLDTVVVITEDVQYTRELRRSGILVIEGDSSDDQVLRLAGIKRAQALMALSHSDTETLLTTMAANGRKPDLFITAAVQHEDFVTRMLRVGANNIIKPYEVAGQFLSNATFRPAVNDFFNTILFEQHRTSAQALQLFLYDDSPWIGKTLGELALRERFKAGVIGLRQGNGSFIYAPEDNHILDDDEIVLAVTTAPYIPLLQRDCRPQQNTRPYLANWQRLPTPRFHQIGKRSYTLADAETAIAGISQHFIICSEGLVAQNAIDKLDPERSFVIISSDAAYTEELLRRGFRVIHGNPTQEEVLHKARISQALAIMIALDDRVQSVLTTLTSRTLNKQLLITVTAESDDMVPRLRRAGADRVISPFRIAAQFVLLATTRPVVSDFLQHVLFNYSVRLETTELYMQDDSPWIGKTIGELLLRRVFSAGVIGIRLANGRFIYSPADTHVIEQYQILIITVPMHQSDLLREVAHGSASKRPRSLRNTDRLKTTIWS
ncbi:MAG: NAD-binding protein [Anaerolineae bacterium]|nr:NAD-binding protein [Anaerolineae bacterium]